MIRKLLTVASTAAMTAGALMADFSYQEKSTITGGALASMMKVAAVFSKQAREPIQTSVAVKGNKMVHRGAAHMSIIDLDAETITSVDLQKKTYSVMTFEQMKQMMEQMQQKMHQQSKDADNNVDLNFKVSVNPAGAAKQVAGMDAKETVVKMEMQGTDQQSGQAGSMTVTADLWLTPEISGYKEVREFQKRMAAKIAWTGANNMFLGRPDVAKGMAEAQKQAAAFEGIPVLSTTVIGGQSNQPDGATPASSQQQQQPAARPSVGGALGGMLGGRFGKKNQQPPQDQPASQGNANASSGTLLEMQTELSGFSSAAVDDAMFAIPAGFKQVETGRR